jgi:hypothetical protein
MGQIQSDLKGLINTELNKIISFIAKDYYQYDSIVNLTRHLYSNKIKEVEDVLFISFIKYTGGEVIDYLIYKLEIIILIIRSLDKIKIIINTEQIVEREYKIKIGKIIDYFNLCLSNSILTFEELRVIEKRIRQLYIEINNYCLKNKLSEIGCPKKIIALINTE